MRITNLREYRNILNQLGFTISITGELGLPSGWELLQGRESYLALDNLARYRVILSFSGDKVTKIIPAYELGKVTTNYYAVTCNLGFPYDYIPQEGIGSKAEAKAYLDKLYPLGQDPLAYWRN